MSSFLLFHEGHPMEIQYTPLIANKEERFVIKAAETGTVIRINDTGNWETLGNSKIDYELLQMIGDTILKQEKKWCLTPNEFNLLTESEQLDAISFLATLIGERVGETLRYVQYQIEGFYVEIQYRIQDNVRIALRTLVTLEL
jgi:hypothetical protein